MQHAPARELLHFIKNSPTCYHVTENIRQKLLANGYTELSERERWEVAPGGKYFVCRNGSSTIAFRVPEMIDGGFAMAAAHSDSPTFRLKEHPDRRSAHYVQLSTEKYGGMLMSTWFDRPLSVAGRVFVRANGEIVEKLVSVDRDLLVIPNVAIHMNRTANDGMKYLANIDTLPLLRRVLTDGKRLCVPRCLPGNDGRMELVEITSLNDLQPGRYGILEPCGGRTIAALEPGALALIPCLAVDKQGVRLGRGAGYYDRFLTRFGQTGPKLLLCPEALVFPALPADEWDVPFTPGEILTENGVR